MGFQINCSNKGCFKTTEARLNLQDNEVYCEACGKSIQNVPIFTKNQMKSLKQTLKPAKGAYSARCEKCKIEATPILINDKLSCPNCKCALNNISKPFEILFRNAIKEKQDL